MSALNGLFSQPVKVINLGLPSFAADLQKQGVAVAHVDWKPPAGGNPRILALLDRIKRWQATLPKKEG